MEVALSLLCIIICLLLTHCFLFYNKRRFLPPGPLPLPFIGTIVPHDVHPSLVHWYDKLREKYGDVFTVFTGNRPTIVINGYKAYEEIFKNNGSAFAQRYSYGILNVMHCNSGIVWNREVYKTLKKICIDSMKRWINSCDNDAEVDELISKLLSHNNTQPISKTVHHIVSKKLFLFLIGDQHNFDQECLIELLKHHYGTVSLCGAADMVERLPILKYLPADPFKWRQFLNAREDYFRFIIEQIERRKQMNSTECTNLLDSFISHNLISEEQLPDVDCVATVLELLLAGLDSIHNIMLWFMLYITIRQDVQENIAAELSTQLGMKKPCWSDRDNLSYTMAVMYEVLRITNVAFTSLPYNTSKDLHYDGVTIPRNSCVLLNLVSLHKDEKLFENPDEFKPERFLNEEGKLNLPAYFQPFSSGRRMCLGHTFSKALIFRSITNIIHNIRLLPVEGHAYSTQCQNSFLSVPQEFPVRCVPRRNGHHNNAPENRAKSTIERTSDGTVETIENQSEM